MGSRNGPRAAGQRRAQPKRSGCHWLVKTCLWIVGIVALVVVVYAAQLVWILKNLNLNTDNLPVDYEKPRLTHYEVLNVSTGATDKEIQSAYKRQLKAVHPDKVRGRGANETEAADAAAQLERLREARDTLKENTLDRCDYDYWDMKLMKYEQYAECRRRAGEAMREQLRREDEEDDKLWEEDREQRWAREARKARRGKHGPDDGVVGEPQVDIFAAVMEWFRVNAARAKMFLAEKAPDEDSAIMRNKWLVALGTLGTSVLLVLAALLDV